MQDTTKQLTSLIRRRTPLLRKTLRNVTRLLIFENREHYVLTLGDKQVRFSTKDEVANKWFYPRYSGNRLHEPSVTLRLVEDIRDAHCFVDIGANLGYYTCIALQLMSSGQVHAFEMDNRNFSLLQANVALNKTDTDVHLYNQAVSDTEQVLSYFRNSQSSVALSLKSTSASRGAEKIDVDSVRLDSVFTGEGVLPDLVKIDVEGAELDVLRGMRRLLETVHKLYIEIHPKRLQTTGQSAQDVLQLLAEYFVLFVVTDPRRGRASELSPIQPDTAPQNGNFFVIAEQRMP